MQGLLSGSPAAASDMKLRANPQRGLGDLEPTLIRLNTPEAFRQICRQTLFAYCFTFLPLHARALTGVSQTFAEDLLGATHHNQAENNPVIGE